MRAALRAGALLVLVVVTAAGCSSGSGERVLAAGEPGPPTAAFAAVEATGATAAVGQRVEGIPAYLAVPPGATLTASAVQDAGTMLAVSLSGTTPAPTADVLAFYRHLLTGAGFHATNDSLLPAGSTGTAYGRPGGELLVVAVVDRGSQRSFSVGGTVARSVNGGAAVVAGTALATGSTPAAAPRATSTTTPGSRRPTRAATSSRATTARRT